MPRITVIKTDGVIGDPLQSMVTLSEPSIHNYKLADKNAESVEFQQMENMVRGKYLGSPVSKKAWGVSPPTHAARVRSAWSNPKPHNNPQSPRSRTLKVDNSIDTLDYKHPSVSAQQSPRFRKNKNTNTDLLQNENDISDQQNKKRMRKPITRNAWENKTFELSTKQTISEKVNALQDMLKSLQNEQEENERRQRETLIHSSVEEKESFGNSDLLESKNEISDEDINLDASEAITNPLTQMSIGDREKDAVFQVLQATLKRHSRIVDMIIDDLESALSVLDPEKSGYIPAEIFKEQLFDVGVGLEKSQCNDISILLSVKESSINKINEILPENDVMYVHYEPFIKCLRDEYIRIDREKRARKKTQLINKNMADIKDDTESSTWASKMRTCWTDDESKRSDLFKDEQRKMKKRNRSHRITIPKPFSFCQRDDKAEERWMARKEEIFQEREEKLHNEISANGGVFHARSIPRTTTDALYERIKEDQDNLRKENIRARIQYHQNQISGFPGMILRDETIAQRKAKREKKRNEQKRKDNTKTKQIVARPAPQRPELSFEELQEQKEESRRLRIERRAQIMLHTSKLPPRMQLHADKMKLKMEEEDLDIKSKLDSHIPKTRNIPNFSQLHSQWDAKRASRRKNHKVTKPKPFSFENEKSRRKIEEKKRKTRRHERLKRQAENTTNTNKRDSSKPNQNSVDSESSISSPFSSHVQNVHPNVSMTRSMELRMNKTHELLRKRQNDIEREKRDQQVRKKREEEARKRITPIINAMEYRRTHRRGHVTLEIAEKKARAKALNFKATAKKQMEDLKKRLEEKIAQRPLLFEREMISAQKQKARMGALSSAANAIYGRDVGTAGIDRSLSSDKFGIFEEEEREILGDQSDSDEE